jgi:hypothetical protein
LASLTDRLARHHSLLIGLHRIPLAHTQFFEAKFDAFVLTIKWFQQLQLREKIRYKLGPRYTHFSRLVKKVKKKKKKFGCILIHKCGIFKMCPNKKSWKRSLVTIKQSFLLPSVVYERHLSTRLWNPKGVNQRDFKRGHYKEPL